MKTKSKWSVVILAVLFLASSPAWAAKGVYLGAGIGYSLIRGDYVILDVTGKGPVKADFWRSDGAYDAEIDFGYGFTDNLYAGLYWGMLSGNVDPAYADHIYTYQSYVIQNIGIQGKYSFGKSKTFAPYIELGVHYSSFAASGLKGDFSGGIGETAGLGLDWFLGQRKRVVLSADLSYLRDTINQTAFQKEQQIIMQGTCLLFKMGYVWRPGM